MQSGLSIIVHHFFCHCGSCDKSHLEWHTFLWSLKLTSCDFSFSFFFLILYFTLFQSVGTWNSLQKNSLKSAVQSFSKIQKSPPLIEDLLWNSRSIFGELCEMWQLKQFFFFLTIPPASYYKLSPCVNCTVMLISYDQICHILPGGITGCRHFWHTWERVWMSSEKPLRSMLQFNPSLHLWSTRLSPLTTRR